MSQQQIKNLGLLLQLRARDCDRLEAEVASKHRLQERYRRNIQRVDELCQASGASAGGGHLALSLNCAAYKGHLQRLKLSQQQDLQLAEADAAVSQRALLAAHLRREQVLQVRSEASAAWQQQQLKREQKQNDEVAGLAWLRAQQAV